VQQVFAPYRATPGELYLSAAETQAAAQTVRPLAARGLPLVSIEPHVAFGPNKQWPLPRWQAVVAARRDRVSFVQPAYGLPVLGGVTPVPSSFRGYCAVLAGCAAHVGAEGGLHHAAAALARPAVVLFGGRIHPRITGYDGHVNLYVDAPGSPCGMVAPCEHCRRCLEAISVEMVVDALDRIIASVLPDAPTSAPRMRSRVDAAARSPRG
jgi:ADP-heptose:LPS heptosyltransferase